MQSAMPRMSAMPAIMLNVSLILLESEANAETGDAKHQKAKYNGITSSVGEATSRVNCGVVVDCHNHVYEACRDTSRDMMCHQE